MSVTKQYNLKYYCHINHTVQIKVQKINFLINKKKESEIFKKFLQGGLFALDF
jgi:hypothetical protein